MKKISKLLSVILCLAMVMSFAFVASAEENEITFTKVAATEITAGTYLISGISAQAMSDGTNTAFMTTEESTSSRLMGTDLPVVDDTVTTGDTAVMWELSDAEGGFYVKNVATEQYLYWNTEKGGNKIYQTASLDEASVWTVVEVSKETGNGYTLAQADGRGLSCNLFGSDPNKYLGFAGYDYATTSCACLLEFYQAGEAAPQPAGPIACEIPGTLEYTFETDDAAAAGVMFQWTATADGELSVARMGESFMTSVEINGTYGEIGNEGYVVKTGDLVAIIVYGYGAGTISVPVEFITAGGSSEAALGTAENPEILTSLSAGVEKTLESGDYYFQYTATKAGELTINTIGDGTHNMTVTVNGDGTRSYSNWDNDGTFITLNVAQGDVLTIVIWFDLGAGTITFNSEFDAGEGPIEPIVPSAPLANGDRIMIFFPNGQSYISATANDTGKKLMEAAEADAAVWTVLIDENGYISFVCDGKYLTSGETGNSLTLEDAASDYSLWTLEEAENGWFVKNVNAAYNGNAQYLEFYSGFTTYGKSATANADIYTFQFVAVKDNDPNQPTGDAIFAVLAIFAASGMGLTAVVSKKH